MNAADSRGRLDDQLDRTTPRRSRWLRALPVLGSLQGYIGLVLVVVAGIATKGDVFLNQANLTNAVGAFASRGILAVGVTLVILAAGIDLSVGSMLALASMTSAMLLVHADTPAATTGRPSRPSLKPTRCSGCGCTR